MKSNAEALVQEFTAAYRREKAASWAWEKAKRLPLWGRREAENKLLHEELYEAWTAAGRVRDDVLLRMENHCGGPKPDTRIVAVMDAHHTAGMLAVKQAKISRKLDALRIKSREVSEAEVRAEQQAKRAFKRAQKAVAEAEFALVTNATNTRKES